MNKREQLYWLLHLYKIRECDVVTFCKAFEGVFYPDQPQTEMSSEEFSIFRQLAEVIVRFTPFIEDKQLYPDVYKNDKEVIGAITVAIEKLQKVLNEKI